MGFFDKLFGGGGEEKAPQKPKKPSGVSAQARELATRMLGGRGSLADHGNLGTLLTLLEKSPSGLADVQAAAAQSVTVKFDMADGGAQFSPNTNQITLNRMKVPRSLATSFVHEATHAQQWHQGRFCNAKTQSKDDFAETVVRMETETFLREAVVGRELMHWERSHGVAEWHQNLNVHTLQMWFALVHNARYAKRPTDAILDGDAGLDSGTVGRWITAVEPYFRRYVEPYRVVQHIKWEISRGVRKKIANETLRGVLTASFSKQKTAEKNPYLDATPPPAAPALTGAAKTAAKPKKGWG